VEKLYCVLDRNAHVLWEHPRLLLQQISNAADWEETLLGDRMSAAVRRSPWPLLRLVNPRIGEQDSGPLRTLVGHTGGVNCVAFSADGERIVSGSSDATAKVWDARTGQEALTLRGHAGRVWGVCFSPDGKRLATASQDGTAKVWDAATGALIVWRPFQAAIHALWFHPKQAQVCVAENGGGTGRPHVYILEFIEPVS
jgi:WD40 repeat protein